MRTVRFEVFGVSRTYLDFYLGFGLSLSIFLLLQTVLLWQMAGLAGAEPQRLRPMIAGFALASLASGLLSWKFLFPVPAVFSAVLTAVLVGAFLVAD